MQKKVLIVVTSHDKLGSTGKPTGYYLPEVSHPVLELAKVGFDFEVASPKGGKAPMDPASRDLTDPANRTFLENPKYVAKIENTIALSEVNPKDYAAVIFAGGHGTMWDFADSKDLQRVATAIYESQGIVSAVCHGPAALLNVKLSNGTYLVAGKKVTGFSNAEEEAAELTKVMPFLLETELKNRGAKYESAALWQERVVSDQRLVTGQNPASAAGVGREVARLLSK